MFSTNVFLTPGQELRQFTVWAEEKVENKRGGIVSAGVRNIGSVKGILASASTEERERWLQVTHEITHKIITPGIPGFLIVPGDYFEFNCHRFSVQGHYNPGGLNHWTVYYCSERCDVSNGFKECQPRI